MRVSRMIYAFFLMLMCSASLSARPGEHLLRLDHLQPIFANRFFADARNFKFVSYSPTGTLADTEFTLAYVSRTATVWDSHASGLFVRRYRLTGVHILSDRRVEYVAAYLPSADEFPPEEIAHADRMVVTEDKVTHEVTIHVDHVFEMCSEMGHLVLSSFLRF